ncbi:MAG: hypothetical protein JW763_05025 [candidate division Zixibacteria bacterium]|nr:hypothetical protein [candidate division Zixibacteria bacterium]
MSKKPTSRKNNTEKETPSDRRKFLKKLGMGVLVTASYSLISLTQFHCSDDVSGHNGGY